MSVCYVAELFWAALRRRTVITDKGGGLQKAADWMNTLTVQDSKIRMVIGIK